MGSKTFEGVRFSVYSLDHTPPHVHGTSAGVALIIDLLGNGNIRLSSRARSTKPPNAPKNVIDKVLRVAAENVSDLEALWEKTHGSR